MFKDLLFISIKKFKGANNTFVTQKSGLTFMYNLRAVDVVLNLSMNSSSRWLNRFDSQTKYQKKY